MHRSAPVDRPAILLLVLGVALMCTAAIYTVFILVRERLTRAAGRKEARRWTKWKSEAWVHGGDLDYTESGYGNVCNTRGDESAPQSYSKQHGGPVRRSVHRSSTASQLPRPSPTTISVLPAPSSAGGTQGGTCPASNASPRDIALDPPPGPLGNPQDGDGSGATKDTWLHPSHPLPEESMPQYVPQLQRHGSRHRRSHSRTMSDEATVTAGPSFNAYPDAFNQPPPPPPPQPLYHPFGALRAAKSHGASGTFGGDGSLGSVDTGSRSGHSGDSYPSPGMEHVSSASSSSSPPVPVSSGSLWKLGLEQGSFQASTPAHKRGAGGGGGVRPGLGLDRDGFSFLTPLSPPSQQMVYQALEEGREWPRHGAGCGRLHHETQFHALGMRPDMTEMGQQRQRRGPPTGMSDRVGPGLGLPRAGAGPGRGHRRSRSAGIGLESSARETGLRQAHAQAQARGVAGHAPGRGHGNRVGHGHVSTKSVCGGLRDLGLDSGAATPLGMGVGYGGCFGDVSPQQRTEVVGTNAVGTTGAKTGVGLRCSSPIYNRDRLLTGGTADKMSPVDTEGGEAHGLPAGRGSVSPEHGGSISLEHDGDKHNVHESRRSPERAGTQLQVQMPVPEVRAGRDLSSAAAAAASLDLPFSALRLTGLIGGGGFGQVYRGTWRGTPVAIKVLVATAQRDLDDELASDFRAEVEMLAALRHPNICLFMGACLSPPNRAIVTELVRRGSLWEVLREQPIPEETMGMEGGRGMVVTPQGCWPWSIILRVAEGTACGMNYLHQHSPPILHRDLKSANLLLDESFNVKICDFGLARLKAFTNSMTGNCGTVQWMAPEVLANSKYSETADVYSFAIVCWEMLTRQCPYEGMSQIQVALAVLNKGQRPRIPDWCSSSFRDLIQACWREHPTQRPSFNTVLEGIRSMS